MAIDLENTNKENTLLLDKIKQNESVINTKDDNYKKIMNNYDELK